MLMEEEGWSGERRWMCWRLFLIGGSVISLALIIRLDTVSQRNDVHIPEMPCTAVVSTARVKPAAVQ